MPTNDTNDFTVAMFIIVQPSAPARKLNMIVQMPCQID
jgi:hypothetical protein